VKKRRQLDRYGRMAVGQRVTYHRAIMSPLTHPNDWRGRDMEFVFVDMAGDIVRLQECDSGALVTIRADNGSEICKAFAWEGREWGGLGSLDVVREAPEQRSLIRETA
jgi:hypothetical protein